jgi:putative Mn2+ efflux pump MntP
LEIKIQRDIDTNKKQSLTHGIVIMQIKQATSVYLTEIVLGVVPVVIAAFAYPLGKRKMMMITDGNPDTYSMVGIVFVIFGMTLHSLTHQTHTHKNVLANWADI